MAEGSIVDAIQASNRAPMLSWGDEWANVFIGDPDEGYKGSEFDVTSVAAVANAITYFTEGDGKNMKCYPCDVEPAEEQFTVTDTPRDGLRFCKWQKFNGTSYVDVNISQGNYTMPAEDVQLRAVFQ